MHDTGALTTYTPESVVAEQDRNAAEKTIAMQRQNEPVLTGLSSYIQNCWEAAKNTKLTTIEVEMLKTKRTLKGVYEPDKLSKIRARGGSEIFMRLTDEKCTAAKAWLYDIILPADEEPFMVKPTPVPELNADIKMGIQQFAYAQLQQDIAMRVIDPARVPEFIEALEADILKKEQDNSKKHDAAVEDKIKDVVVESGWRDALKSFIDDLVDYKAGILKGPILRKKREIVWGEDGTPVVTDRIVKAFDSPSPFDIYPSPSASGPNDGYLLEKHTLTRKYLVALKGVQGYDSAAIDLVLEAYGRGGLRNWAFQGREHERQRLEGKWQVEHDPEGKIDALQFWGSVQGISLLDHGINPNQVPDLWAEYEVECWIIGNYIIKCALNENPLGKRPYHVTSFRKRKGSFWGDGLPDLIEDCQDMVNAASRNLVNNMGVASGPQIGVDKAALPAGESVTGIIPFKVWQFDMKELQNTTRAPIWFFQPKTMVNELIKVWEEFSVKADEISGVPKYSYGAQGATSGALSTATGFSMMMSNASRGIKMVVSNIDTDVIEPSITSIHQMLLLYDNDPILRKGDVKLVAKGSASLVAKEQNQIRRQELLQTVMGSEPALNIIGPDGLANVLRKVFQGVDFGADEIVPDKMEILRNQFFMSQQGQLPAPEKGTETNQAGDKAGGADYSMAA